MVEHVTNYGLGQAVRDLVSANTQNRVGWGTGSGAAVDATDLVTPGSEGRVVATLASVTTVVTDDTFQAIGTITSAGAQNITEAGLFTGDTGPNMCVYGDFVAIPVTIGESIKFTFDVTSQRPA